MSTAIKFSLADAARKLADSSESSVVLATHGEARLLLYAPEGLDTQTPHKRDEVYVVVSGSGTFRRGDETTTFVAGDMLFVGAGVEHRFENFTDDFQIWVIFFGPEGGSIQLLENLRDRFRADAIRAGIGIGFFNLAGRCCRT